MKEVEFFTRNLRVGGSPILRMIQFRESGNGRESYPINPLVSDVTSANELQYLIFKEFVSTPESFHTPLRNSFESVNQFAVIELRENYITESDPGIRHVLRRRIGSPTMAQKPLLPPKPVLALTDDDYYSSTDSGESVVSKSSSKSFDPGSGCRRIGHFIDFAEYRSKMENEMDVKLVKYSGRYFKVVPQFLVQAMLEILVFVAIMARIPNGFTRELFTTARIGPAITVIVVMFLCAFNASATFIILAVFHAIGRYGKRWIAVYLIAFLSVCSHIYGCVYMIGAVVHLGDEMDHLMIHETLQGLNSTIWAQSQSFFGCCGIVNYKSWNWNRYNVGSRIYPKSCCDYSRSHCWDPPTEKDVYLVGCLDSETLTLSIICYSVFFLYSITAIYSGYICYATFKMHNRYKWLGRNRDAIVSIIDLNRPKKIKSKVIAKDAPGVPPTEIIYTRETVDFNPYKKLQRGDRDYVPAVPSVEIIFTRETVDHKKIQRGERENVKL